MTINYKILIKDMVVIELDSDHLIYNRTRDRTRRVVRESRSRKIPISITETF